MTLERTVKGSRRTGLEITATHSDGDAFDLTGATLTGVILADDGSVRNVTGALTITDASNGVFQWSFEAADVAVAGKFEVQFKADFGSTIFELSFPERWVVEESLSPTD